MIETIKTFDDKDDAKEYANIFMNEFKKYMEDNELCQIGLISESAMRILSIETKNKKQLIISFMLVDLSDVIDSPKNEYWFAITSSSTEELTKFMKHLNDTSLADLYSTTK